MISAPMEASRAKSQCSSAERQISMANQALVAPRVVRGWVGSAESGPKRTASQLNAAAGADDGAGVAWVLDAV